MQTKPKANSIITSRFDTDRNTIIFTVKDQGDVELDLSKVHEDNMRQAAIHGWNQRIPDAAAIGRTDKDGRIIPEAERTRIKFERMNELCRHYESGTDRWNRTAEGDGSGGRALTIEAIARVQGIAYAEAVRRVEALAEHKHGGDTKAALAVLRKAGAIQAAMAEIRAEREPKTDLNAEEMLSELK